jgi:hypothetical protein
MRDANVTCMRDQILVDRKRIQQLEREIIDLKMRLSDGFSAEEMDAIREQLASRLEEAQKAHEELEWNVRMELSKVREAEASCQRAAMEMRQVAASLASLLGEEETTVMGVQPFNPRRRRMFA